MKQILIIIPVAIYLRKNIADNKLLSEIWYSWLPYLYRGGGKRFGNEGHTLYMP